MFDRNIQLHSEKYIRFVDGKTKALAFSYDDGVVADRRLVEIFDKYNLVGTFNLNTSCFGDEYRDWHNRMSESETKDLFFSSGHEIGIHGAYHAFLDKISLAEASFEIVDNRKKLEDMFGKIINGGAYAYGAYNSQIVDMLTHFGIKYMRTTLSSYSFAIPQHPLELKATCHHTDSKFVELSSKFFSGSPNDENKQREGWLFILWGHSFEFDDNNNWFLIEDFCSKVDKNEIWNAGLLEIIDYVNAYKSLVFSLDGSICYNPSAKDVWFEKAGKVYLAQKGATIHI